MQGLVMIPKDKCQQCLQLLKRNFLDLKKARLKNVTISSWKESSLHYKKNSISGLLTTSYASSFPTSVIL